MRPHTLRRVIANAVLAALTFAVAACGSDDDPRPLPAPTSTPPSSSPSPTTTPAWESKYTSEQIQAYNEALARWETYEQRAEPIWAKGKVTPAAEALFKEYWVAWAVPLNTLQTYQQNGLAVSGVAHVLSSVPASIDLESATASVVIKQCIDPASISVTKDGEAQASSGQKPYVRTITLDRAADRPFLVGGFKDITNSKKVSRCAP
jgi:hypothetical protein